VQPPMPDGVREGIVRGLYPLREAGKGKLRVQLLGSGSILREDWKVAADVWSATSMSELRREGLEAQRWNMLHPEQPPRLSHVERCLGPRQGPVVAATDYVKLHADQIRPFVPHRFSALGTDGFGRSDTRSQLRTFFEVDRRWVTVAALKALADDGEIPARTVAEALSRYGIDPKKPCPVEV